jgi:hypothetical protein
MNVLRPIRIGVLAGLSLIIASCASPKLSLGTDTQGAVITVRKPVQQQLSIQSIQVESNGTWTSPAFQVKYAERNEVVLGTKGEASLRVSVPGANGVTAAQVTYRTAPGKPLKTKLVNAK